MSLSTFAPNVGGTTSTAGGSATNLIQKSNNGKKAEFILDDGATYLLQTEIDFSIVEPVIKPAAPNGYTQKRNTVFVKVPKVLANTNRTVNTYKLETAVDVETSEAEFTAGLNLLVQAVVDAAVADFRNKQSIM